MLTPLCLVLCMSVIEKYTKSTRFCLLCNSVNKIIPALQSRCTRFRFGPLETEQVKNRLEFVIKQEKSVEQTRAVTHGARAQMCCCLLLI
jgi:DNA polymerase III delta prime subunit